MILPETSGNCGKYGHSSRGGGVILKELCTYAYEKLLKYLLEYTKLHTNCFRYPTVTTGGVYSNFTIIIFPQTLMFLRSGLSTGSYVFMVNARTKNKIYKSFKLKKSCQNLKLMEQPMG
jgi:hypothetical protein